MRALSRSRSRSLAMALVALAVMLLAFAATLVPARAQEPVTPACRRAPQGLLVSGQLGDFAFVRTLVLMMTVCTPVPEFVRPPSITLPAPTDPAAVRNRLAGRVATGTGVLVPVPDSVRSSDVITVPIIG